MPSNVVELTSTHGYEGSRGGTKWQKTEKSPESYPNIAHVQQKTLVCSENRKDAESGVVVAGRRRDATAGANSDFSTKIPCEAMADDECGDQNHRDMTLDLLSTRALIVRCWQSEKY